MISGPRAIARAKPTRFFMPPDSSAGALSSMPSSPTQRSTSRTRSWMRSSGQSVCWRRPKATFSPTFIESNSAAY